MEGKIYGFQKKKCSSNDTMNFYDYYKDTSEKDTNQYDSDKSKNNIMFGKERKTKKVIKLKDLNLLKEKNSYNNENKFDQKFPNEDVYFVNSDNSNNENYDKQNKIIYRNDSVETKKDNYIKQLSFLTKEKKLVSLIQMQDIVLTKENWYNNNNFHTHTLISEDIHRFNATKNSKLNSMKKYNYNLDYYKLNNEINKKHMVNTQFNFNQKQLNSDKSIIRSNLRLFSNSPNFNDIENNLNETNESLDNKANLFAQIFDKNKIYLNDDLNIKEEPTFRKSLRLSYEKNKIMKRDNEIRQNIYENQEKRINQMNNLKLERKKTINALFKANKEDPLSVIEEKQFFYKRSETLQNKPKHSINNKMTDNNKKIKNNEYKRISSNNQIKIINSEELSSKDSNSNINRMENNIIHKMGYKEINLNLERQKRDINNLLNMNRRHTFNSENNSEEFYKNLFNPNSATNYRRNSRTYKETNNSMEKYKDNNSKISKLDEEYRRQNNIESINDSTSYNNKISNEGNSIDLIETKTLPILNSNRGILNNESNKIDSIKEFNKNYQKSNTINFNKTTKNLNKKKKISEPNTFALQKLNQSNYYKTINNDNEYNIDNLRKRYMNQISNSIFNIAESEILDKKSLKNKLIKPFTQDKIQNISKLIREKSEKVNIEIIKEDENEEENNPIQNNIQIDKHYGASIKQETQILNTNSSYYNFTCPTQTTIGNYTLNKDINDIEKNEAEKNKLEKIKKLKQIMNMGKMKKLNELKNEICDRFNNMHLLENKIINKVNDSTLDFRNKINELQKKYYSTHMKEWVNKDDCLTNK